MTLEEILNTDHFTALPEGTIIEEELNCQDEEIERLPNYSTFLSASEFIDLGIINDQATVQATSVTATVETDTVQAIPATQSEEDSAGDLPIAQSSEISAKRRSATRTYYRISTTRNGNPAI